MVAQDGGSVNKGLEKNSDPALLAAVLKGAVQRRQQLDILKTSAGAALPRQPPHGASQRQSRSMPQPSMADRDTRFSKALARQPPS